MNRDVMRRRRMAYGMTQAELATLAGVSPGVISRYEAGADNVTEVVERAIISAMNDWWQSLSHDEKHQCKLLEWAYQLGEEDERYHVKTLSYMIREIGMYQVDLQNKS